MRTACRCEKCAPHPDDCCCPLHWETRGKPAMAAHMFPELPLGFDATAVAEKSSRTAHAAEVFDAVRATGKASKRHQWGGYLDIPLPAPTPTGHADGCDCELCADYQRLSAEHARLVEQGRRLAATRDRLTGVTALCAHPDTRHDAATDAIRCEGCPATWHAETAPQAVPAASAELVAAFLAVRGYPSAQDAVAKLLEQFTVTRRVR